MQPLARRKRAEERGPDVAHVGPAFQAQVAVRVVGGVELRPGAKAPGQVVVGDGRAVDGQQGGGIGGDLPAGRGHVLTGVEHGRIGQAQGAEGVDEPHRGAAVHARRGLGLQEQADVLRERGGQAQASPAQNEIVAGVSRARFQVEARVAVVGLQQIAELDGGLVVDGNPGPRPDRDGNHSEQCQTVCKRAHDHPPASQVV